MSYKAWNAGTCIVCSEPYKKGTQIESCKHEGTIFGYRHPSCAFVPPTFEPDPNFKPSQEQATPLSHRLLSPIPTSSPRRNKLPYSPAL